ncbi:MAG: hypothetical protein QNJ57_05230 [Flavobacteriaceae bacterium]|nr:hypothetical protein [Flavobacteriaceae bacterium]
MKSTLKIILISLITVLFLASCSSDSEDDITPPPQGAITYDDNVRAIINNNCLACHIDPPVNGAPFPLTNYDQVSSRAAQILTAISRQAGAAGAMPPSGRLPQATIDIVDQWIQDGLLEN